VKIADTIETLSIEILSLQLQRNRLCEEHICEASEAKRAAIMKQLVSIDGKLARRFAKRTRLRDAAVRAARVQQNAWPLLDGFEHVR